jgi:hypothetical protein
MPLIAGPLTFCSADDRPDDAGDGGPDSNDSRIESKENRCILLPRPAIHTQAWSESTVTEVMANPTEWTPHNFCLPSISFKKHRVPVSVPITASWSEILATQVNVLSPNVPNKQFLPCSAFGAGPGVLACGSTCRRDLVGDPGVVSGSLQTFTWRTPTLGRRFSSASNRKNNNNSSDI